MTYKPQHSNGIKAETTRPYFGKHTNEIDLMRGYLQMQQRYTKKYGQRCECSLGAWRVLRHIQEYA